MKKLIAYPLAWFLFSISKYIWKKFKHNSYSNFAVWSFRVQTWGKLTKPWS